MGYIIIIQIAGGTISLAGNTDGPISWWNSPHGKTTSGTSWYLDRSGTYCTSSYNVYIPTIFRGYGERWDVVTSSLDLGMNYTFYTNSSNVPYMYTVDANMEIQLIII